MVLIDIENEFKLFSPGEEIPCQCEYCEELFGGSRCAVAAMIRQNREKCLYCSWKCLNSAKAIDTRVKVTCSTCQKELNKFKTSVSPNTTNSFFCNRKCKMQWRRKEIDCSFCGIKFIKADSKIKANKHGLYCSWECFQKGRIKLIPLNCTQCEKSIFVAPCNLKKWKNHFCSHSCNAKYQFTHNRKVIKRSKLEIWLEQRLSVLYPYLKIVCNNRKILGGLELDIFICDLNIAFELNGPGHYFPIYGDERLSITQTNDITKKRQCEELGIFLSILDTSKHHMIDDEHNQKYLGIVTDIINSKLSEQKKNADANLITPALSVSLG